MLFARQISTLFWFLVSFLLWSGTRSFGLNLPRTGRQQVMPTLLFQQQQSNDEGPLDFLLNPFQSKIPKEIEKEIYQAEGNTPAARDRGKRIAIYACCALVGLVFAFFNAFLTELRTTNVALDDVDPFVLEDSSFAWVQSSFLFQFLFLNKIGGGICLLGGAGAGLMAELEFDSRRQNAERIWEEMQRRREAAASKAAKQSSKTIKSKRRSGKEAKRLGALSEVVTEMNEPVETSLEDNAEVEDKTEKKDEGVLGTLKGFYEKADTMAASQALLLNKNLEDAGLIEKITDETGLKVIGKGAAAKLKDQSSEGSVPKNDT